MDNNTTELRFKTNINCGGCIATVKPFLDKAEEIIQWDVNTVDKNKVLTVQSKGITAQQVIDTVQKAGFKIESLNL
ncbi:MAG: heavy-metal-associated domain-containing protein [Chitinophagaceae bacterium]|nr:heavy-metal-associated domain-containing protein [Chitinophagaceae bacterium]